MIGVAVARPFFVACDKSKAVFIEHRLQEDRVMNHEPTEKVIFKQRKIPP